jgi:hypothetical protein
MGTEQAEQQIYQNLSSSQEKSRCNRGDLKRKADLTEIEQISREKQT